VPLRRAWSGRPCHCLVVEPDDLVEIDERVLRVIVLAELAVDPDHALDLEPTERFNLRVEGVGIAHGGLDEVVYIDRLHVEGLAEMATAVAQDLNDLGDIVGGVALGLDRIRARRDLTQRQKSRQNF
jgi:hypothetical protein